jgi:hypothetical protein
MPGAGLKKALAGRNRHLNIAMVSMPICAVAACNYQPGGSVFLREVIRVIPAISVDIDQCEAMIAEDTSVAVDAVGKIPKRHAVHLALFAIQAVDVSGCEKERRIVLNDAGDIRNCPNRFIRIEVEDHTPRDRSIEPAIRERAGLNNSSYGKRFRAITPKPCQHRTRTI